MLLVIAGNAIAPYPSAFEVCAAEKEYVYFEDNLRISSSSLLLAVVIAVMSSLVEGPTSIVAAKDEIPVKKVRKNRV